MKKIIIVSLTFLFILPAISCNQDTTEQITTEKKYEASPTVTTVTEDTSNNEPLTEEEIIDIFTSDQEYKNCYVTNCVIASDGAYGLKGIVLYTEENDNPSQLAFVNDTVAYPLGLCTDHSLELVEDYVLTYEGNGVVTFSLVNRDTKIIYDYTVSYTVSEDGRSTELAVNSKERD